MLLISILSLFSLIASSEPARVIDIRINENNRPFIPNVTVPGIRRPHQPGWTRFDAVLAVERYSFVDMGPIDYFDPNEATGIHNAEYQNLVPSRLVRYNMFRGGSPATTTVTIGIGRVEQGISMLRDAVDTGRGLLIFDDLERAHFNSSCLFESISRISFVRDVRGLPFDATAQIQRHLVWSNRITSDIATSYTWIGSLDRLPNPPGFSLPSEMVDALSRIIYLSGGRRVDTRVANCSRDILIEQLPEIHLSFVTANITLFPEDYIKFNTETNECVLNYARESLTTNFFDPLAFAGINIHMAQDDLFICDVAEH